MSAEKYYAIITNSHWPYCNEKLARISPDQRPKNSSFWTTTEPWKVWKMDRETAEEVCGNLSLNGPQIYGYEKAISIIERQRDEEILMKEGNNE